MNVFVLVICDREMRPRCDIATTAVFSNREVALNAMEREISNAIADGHAEASEIVREPNYAATVDGRFMWKVEGRRVC